MTVFLIRGDGLVFCMRTQIPSVEPLKKANLLNNITSAAVALAERLETRSR